MADIKIPHRYATPVNIHTPYFKVFADTAEMAAASGFTVDDLKRKAYKEDTNEEFILINHSPIVWKSTTPVFGQGYDHIATAKDAEQSNNTTTYIDALVKSIEVPVDSTICLSGQFQWQISSTSQSVEVRWTVDGAEIYDMKVEPKDSTSWYHDFGTAPLVLSAGTHEVKIQFRSSSPSATARVRNLTIAHWRVL